MVGEVYPDWTAVYRDNVDRIYRVMYAKVGNRPDAEDLTAEVFAAALRPLRVSASVGEVRAYLLAAARTVLAGYWRAHARARGDDPGRDHRGRVRGADRAVAGRGPTAAILGALPDNYRRILELRFLDSCTVGEAAAAMGISTANAKVLQHRALRRAAQVAQEVSR